MDIYCIFNAILVMLLFSSQLKTVYAKYPFVVHNIVNEDPKKFSGNEQYESDLIRDIEIMPREIVSDVNREPETDEITKQYYVSKGMPERYSRISGASKKVISGKPYSSYNLEGTEPSEHHYTIKHRPKELSRAEYNINRSIHRAYDLANSEMENRYYHRNYGSNVSEIIQRTYHANVGRELEDLSNETYYNSDEYRNSENEEDSYYEVMPRTYQNIVKQEPLNNYYGKNEGGLGLRRMAKFISQQSQIGSNEANSDENENEEEDDSTNYDDKSETENEDDVDRYVHRTSSSNDKHDGVDVKLRRNFDTMNPEQDSRYSSAENADTEDGDDADLSMSNYDDSYDIEKDLSQLISRQEGLKTVDADEDYNSVFGMDMGELASPRRGGSKTPRQCANSGGECKSRCHKSLQYGSRGCTRGQFCCLVAYRVVALY